MRRTARPDAWPSARRTSTRRCAQARRCSPRRRGTVGRAEAQRIIGQLLAMRGEIERGTGADVRRDRGRTRGGLARRGGGHRAARRVRRGQCGRPRRRRSTRCATASTSSTDSVNVSYRGTTALLLADLLADARRARRGRALVRPGAGDDERGRPGRTSIRVDALEGFLAAPPARTPRASGSANRAVGLAATIDMYENKARTYEWHVAHARARRQAGRGARGGSDRARDLRGQGRRPGERVDTRAARLAPGLNDARGRARLRRTSRGARAAGLRGRSTRRRPANLTWVMPAEGCVQEREPIVVVVAAGAGPPRLAGLPADALVIAADGGLERCRELGLRASVVVGDFDSVAAEALAAAERERRRAAAAPRPQGRHRPGAGARRGARPRCASAILVVASAEGRLDHLLASLLLLGSDRYADVEVDALVGAARVHVVRGERALDGTPGELVTLLALGGPRRGRHDRRARVPAARRDARAGLEPWRLERLRRARGDGLASSAVSCWRSSPEVSRERAGTRK